MASEILRPKLAYRAVLDVFALTKTFPRDEQYELTTQIRRASRSAPVSIAEAYRRRKYPKAFVDKLSQADTEATETQVWLDFSYGLEYLDADVHVKLVDTYEAIGRILHGMMANPSAFIPR